METIQHWLPTAVAIVLLAGIASVGLVVFRVPAPWSVITAIARAALQLALLSLILTGILGDPLWVAVGLVVMFVAAVLTAGRRARASARATGGIAVAMLAGPLVVMTIVFATGALELSPRYALAIGGIVIGNTMTIAILTHRIFFTTVNDHWDEVEGWLALGATPRRSTIDLARAAIRTALLPSIDQTRTTGIVVLPGAFVGAVFAGASPLEAGRFQLVVLASILAAGVLTAGVLTQLIGAVSVKPGPAEKSPATGEGQRGFRTPPGT
jgi:putative ABC transport system permease protein